jgi:hypothetical protein
MPVILAIWEAEIGRIAVRGHPSKQFARPHFQNNQSQMDRRCGSRNRAPAWQVQTPEFKSHSHLKKKKIKGQSLMLFWTGWSS